MELREITKRYPGVLALDGVSIGFEAGDGHGGVGETGAGNSTLMKVMAGAIRPDAGELWFEGTRYEHMSPQLAHRLGIEIVYQEFNLLPSLTVAENLFVGELKGHALWIDRRGMEEEAGRLFETMGVKIDPRARVRELSVASMQLVEIAKSLRRGARVLIMDEPTAPLTLHEVDILFGLIRKLRAEGITVIYISHRLEEIFELSDRVTIMRDGRVVELRQTADTTKEDLIRGMIGRQISELFPVRSPVSGETVLEVRGLCGSGDRDIHFDLRRGEILGVSGLVGAGRTEMARMLSGADPMESGEVTLEGKKLHIRNPKDALEQGITLLPEDRKRQGLFLGLPIDQNISIASLEQFSRFGVMLRHRQRRKVLEQIKVLRIATPSPVQLVKNLSGGNQQKVVLAKWLITNAKVMIFDEPTRGVDVGAKQEIYNLMGQLTGRGISIIMISSDMEEILGMSDRILVLYEGKQMGILERGAFSQEAVLTLASGYQGSEEGA